MRKQVFGSKDEATRIQSKAYQVISLFAFGVSTIIDKND